MIKIELPFETADEVILALLYEGYELAYWAYIENLKCYNSDPVRYAFKKSDIEDQETYLKSFETLVNYYTPRADEIVPQKLQAIRDRLDYKHWIMLGMSRLNN